MDYFKRTDFPLFPQRYFQLLCLWFRRLYFFCVGWPSWHNPEGIQISSWDQTGALVGWMCKLQHYINGKISSTLQISFYFHFTFGLGCFTLWKMSGVKNIFRTRLFFNAAVHTKCWMNLWQLLLFASFLHLAKVLVTQIVQLLNIHRHCSWSVDSQISAFSFFIFIFFKIFFLRMNFSQNASCCNTFGV